MIRPQLGVASQSKINTHTAQSGKQSGFAHVLILLPLAGESGFISRAIA